ARRWGVRRRCPGLAPVGGTRGGGARGSRPTVGREAEVPGARATVGREAEVPGAGARRWDARRRCPGLAPVGGARGGGARGSRPAVGRGAGVPGARAAGGGEAGVPGAGARRWGARRRCPGLAPVGGTRGGGARGSRPTVGREAEVPGAG